MKSLEILQFIENLEKGRVCVHPTDTIPGLACDPRNPSAVRALEEIKKRTEKKPFVGLVASFEKAQVFWEELDPLWKRVLAKVWPNTVSFLGRARKNLPSCLVSQTGELALRVPRLRPEAEWFYEILQRMDVPLPSTSINWEGERPLLNRSEIESFARNHGVYLTSLAIEGSQQQASSLIRIEASGAYTFLREGAYSRQMFEDLFTLCKKELAHDES